MVQSLEINVSPDRIDDIEFIKSKALRKLKVKSSRVHDARIIRKSLDARGKSPVFRLKMAIYIDEDYRRPSPFKNQYQAVNPENKVIVIGAGPAGLFAALEMLETGIKPILLERGKDVQSRRRDLRAIQQDGTVNPDSNYCFGEGGAGTYSDGKLYTRSHKRGKIEKVLRILVEHGAKEDILIDAHPHIGSNKLPGIIKEIRKTIVEFGGEVHFNTRVTDFLIADGKVKGVLTSEGKEYLSSHVIVATGHSARDIFHLFKKLGLRTELKPFALGVRIEHPQALIDQIQYNQRIRSQNLPAASYSLSCQVDNHGVFSFCMCPGGLIVPAATNPGEIVLNGMSLSRRDSKYANAGTVVSVDKNDLKSDSVWSALDFQSEVEKTMFKFGDGSQQAPAQRMDDFVQKKISSSLNDCSYIPGAVSAPLHSLLPPFIYDKLRAGILQFGKKMKGYYTNEANILATESRTSSPVRIPRDKDSFEHPDCTGLYPCGEGAGYAGGILSAAMDGQNVAKKIFESLN